MRSTRVVVSGLVAIAGLLALGARPAGALTFTAVLNGANERPVPIVTEGFGNGSVDLNAAETQISILLSWNILTGTTTIAHIHGPGGVNDVVAPNFDLTDFIQLPKANGGVLNGGVPVLFDVTPAQVDELKNGLWYFNVHSTFSAIGEVRGQIVPEPGSVMLLAAGLGGLAWMGRRTRVS